MPCAIISFVTTRLGRQKPNLCPRLQAGGGQLLHQQRSSHFYSHREIAQADERENRRALIA
jgi:hypothetical protein